MPAKATSRTKRGTLLLGPWGAARTAFSSKTKKAAVLYYNIFVAPLINKKPIDVKNPRLAKINGAILHRMSWDDIYRNVRYFVNGIEKSTNFLRWTERFLDAGAERIRRIEKRTKEDRKKRVSPNLDVGELLKISKESQREFKSARDALAAKPRNKAARKDFDKQANNFHANVPDIGPHSGNNNVVQEYSHPNFPKVKAPRGGRPKERSPSPFTDRMLDMSPPRLAGFPVDNKKNYIEVRGGSIPPGHVSRSNQARLSKYLTVERKGFVKNPPFG
jgi:hypothetical protein